MTAKEKAVFAAVGSVAVGGMFVMAVKWKDRIRGEKEMGRYAGE